jgi:uncharacterized protein (TIGR03067 family)
MTRHGMTFLAIGLILGISQVRADDKADKEKLQGGWSLVAVEENGENQKVGEDSDKHMKLKIEGDKLHVSGAHEVAAACKIDSSKKPKEIDLTLMGGDIDGKVMKGLFELDGDTLKICIGTPDTPDRPTEFKSKDDVKVFTFKREKK